MNRRSLRAMAALCWAAGSAIVVLVPHSALAQADAVVCGDYATEAVVQTTKNKQMQCGYEGPRWDTEFAAHYNWCMSLGGEASPRAVEGLERVAGLKTCTEIEAAKQVLQPGGDGVAGVLGKGKPDEPARPPTPTAQVFEDVDVYAEPDGESEYLGILAAGSIVVLVGACQKHDWCQVQGPAVPTGYGWVWGALQF